METPSPTDCEKIAALEKRLEEATKTLAELENAIAKLPQPELSSATQKHFYDAAIDLGLTNFRMVRVSGDYYEWPLEKRRDALGAASIHQLCKTILIENTKSTAKDCSDKNNSRFYAVILQYTSRRNAMNLFKYVRGLIPGSSRNHYHFRDAKPADVAHLTNSEFNGVCPFGNKVNIPIILSSRLLDVPTGWMFVGGGEPDLKLGFPVKDFIEKSGCFVADIAEDGVTLDGEVEPETPDMPQTEEVPSS